MGVKAYMIADATVGIIAQRLLRRICPKCRVAREMNERDKQRLLLKGSSNPIIYDPKDGGCAYCNGTGYRGRIGVYEIMSVTDKIRDVIGMGARADEIQKAALQEGMTTLRIGAAKLVLKGITSINEVERISVD
jgi:type IV pilus assembly protein PilB